MQLKRSQPKHRVAAATVSVSQLMLQLTDLPYLAIDQLAWKRRAVSKQNSANAGTLFDRSTSKSLLFKLHDDMGDFPGSTAEMTGSCAVPGDSPVTAKINAAMPFGTTATVITRAVAAFVAAVIASALACPATADALPVQ